jgi:hypothetical protein
MVKALGAIITTGGVGTDTSEPSQKEAIEQLSNDVEKHLNQLEVYLGAEAVDALHSYVTSQIALLLLDFEAIKQELASDKREIGP